MNFTPILRVAQSLGPGQGSSHSIACPVAIARLTPAPPPLAIVQWLKDPRTKITRELYIKITVFHQSTRAHGPLKPQQCPHMPTRARNERACTAVCKPMRCRRSPVGRQNLSLTRLPPVSPTPSLTRGRRQKAPRITVPGHGRPSEPPSADASHGLVFRGRRGSG
jgi:hypothetical protein